MSVVTSAQQQFIVVTMRLKQIGFKENFKLSIPIYTTRIRWLHLPIPKIPIHVRMRDVDKDLDLISLLTFFSTFNKYHWFLGQTMMDMYYIFQW